MQFLNKLKITKNKDDDYVYDKLYTKQLLTGNPDWNKIQQILRKYPNAISMRSRGIYGSNMTVLMHACWYYQSQNTIDTIKFLLENSSPDIIKSQDTSGRTALHYIFYVKHNDAVSPSFEVIKLLTEKYPEIIESKTDEGVTALDMACSREGNFMSLEIVKLLIDRNPKVIQTTNNKGFTALHWACQRKNPSFEVVKLLIKKNPSLVERTTITGNTALHFACRFNESVAVIKLLMDTDSKLIESIDNDGWTALHFACRFNESVAVKQLLIETLIETNPTKIELKTKDGETALHMACSYNVSIDVVKLLIDRYPKLCEMRNNIGETALHVVCRVYSHSPVVVIKLLIKAYPKIIELTQIDGRTALHYACQHRLSIEVLSLLIDSDSKLIKSIDKNGWTALHYACKDKHFGFQEDLKIVKLLRDKYPEAIFLRNNDNKTPSDLAENVLIKDLLKNNNMTITDNDKNNINVNNSSYDNNVVINDDDYDDGGGSSASNSTSSSTATPSCSSENDTKLYNELYTKQLLTNNCNWWEIHRILQKYPDGISMRSRDGGNKTVLMYACYDPILPIDTIHFLLKNSSIDVIESQDQYGKTALHYACYIEDPSIEVVTMLINCDPKIVELTTSNGNTALHAACYKGNPPIEIVKLMIEKYPKIIELTNNSGDTALHIECNSINPSFEVVNLLIKTYSKIIELKSNNGNTALHYACSVNKPSLEVVKLLAEKYPEAIRLRNNRNKTPSDIAKSTTIIDLLDNFKIGNDDNNNVNSSTNSINIANKKYKNHNNDNASKTATNSIFNNTFNSPKNIPSSDVSTSCSTNQNINNDESKRLLNVVEWELAPVQLSSLYCKSLAGSKTLGEGAFGAVYHGVIRSDINAAVAPMRQYNLAIKELKQEILTGGNIEEIKHTKETFLLEQKILSQFCHPNIARLYGYAFPDEDIRSGYYLVYEHGERGSLDNFWCSDNGRVHLESFILRVRIAINVLTGLLFLHKGNGDNIKACFHRDVKSANVVLALDYTAKLIDCGLGKFVTDNDQSKSSAGIKGTPGYICTSYMNSHKFSHYSDYYSYGVLLLELWTGRLQKDLKFQMRYFSEELDAKSDADKFLDVFQENEIPNEYFDFVQIALDCMAHNIKKRPNGIDIKKRLTAIFNVIVARQKGESGPIPTQSQKVEESGSILCKHCREDPVLKNFDLCRDCMDQQNHQEICKRLHYLENQTQDILKGVHTLNVKLIYTIPRLFIIVPSNVANGWEHPRSWLRSRFKKKYYLFFICEHSYQPVSPYIKLYNLKEWVSTIAPVLAYSLVALQIVGRITLGLNLVGDDNKMVEVYITSEYIRDMLQQVNLTLQDNGYSDMVNRLQDGKLNESDINTLNGESYKFIENKAIHDDNEWSQKMEPVTSENSNKIKWVSKDIACDPQNGYTIIQR